MSSFFLPAKRSLKERKRKRTSGAKRRGKSEPVKRPKKKAAAADQNEEIVSDSDIEEAEGKTRRTRDLHLAEEEEEEEEETAPEKRLRLAKEYLAQLEEEAWSKKEDAEVDHDAIAHRLKEDVLEQAGKLQRQVADTVAPPDPDAIKLLKGHQLPVTCVAIAPNDRVIFSGAKDSSIIKWDVESGCKLYVFKGQRRRSQGRRKGRRGGKAVGGGGTSEDREAVGHSGHVLALAISSDGKYLVSGGHDGLILAWDAESNSHLHTFTGHRDSVSGLVFQRGTHELFSCSFDRTVKIWNLDEMAYVETLFGHQNGISSIDCLSRERPVTAGMNDRTVRVWKVVQESQLVFNGHKASIDCVRLINEEHFISGSQDGSLAVWAVVKKKPLVSTPHHSEAGHTASEVGDGWVTTVTAYPNSDLVASGSSDGCVRLWKCGKDYRTLTPCVSVSLVCAKQKRLPLQLLTRRILQRGFINCLQFSHSGSYLVAAVGQEHRLGRWWKDKSVRNSVAIIPILRTEQM